MGFEQQNVNYAAEYSQALANNYPYISYFGEIWANGNSTKYKPGMGKTMYIPSLTVKGAHAVDRDAINGNFSRNWNNEYQAVTLQMDREWDTLIDPMDMNETDMVATIANITKTFVEFEKIPEMDAFLASTIAGLADAGNVDTTAPTAANVLELWDGYLEKLANARIPRDRAVAYVAPGFYKLLKTAAGITRFVDVGGAGRNVDRNVAALDGVRIKEVPADLLKSAYDFTEGWAAGSSAKQINLLMIDPEAVAAPVKYETSMVSAPTAQSKGKYLYYERYYYGAFALNNRKAGIIVNQDA